MIVLVDFLYLLIGVLWLTAVLYWANGAHHRSPRGTIIDCVAVESDEYGVQIH